MKEANDKNMCMYHLFRSASELTAVKTKLNSAHFWMLLLMVNVTLFFAAPLLCLITNNILLPLPLRDKRSMCFFWGGEGSDPTTPPPPKTQNKINKNLCVADKNTFSFLFISVMDFLIPEEQPPKASSGCQGWRLGYFAPLCRCSPAGARRSGTKAAQWCSSCNQTWNQSSASFCLWAGGELHPPVYWWYVIRLSKTCK